MGALPTDPDTPPDEPKPCPVCGRVRECIGEQRAEQLDRDPPRFFALRTRTRSDACRHCDPTTPREPRVVTAGPAAEQRRATRARESEGVLRALQRWRDRARPGARPKSPRGRALGYATNNWAARVRYRDEGYLAIDNNLAPRTLRAGAVGRNNWGVVGSAVGGQTAATLYGIVGTCTHLSIDPWAYLREARPRVLARGEKPTTEQRRGGLPDRWLLTRTRDRPIVNASLQQSK